MTRWLNRTLRGAAVLAAGCVVLLVLALGWLGYLQWTGNVHVVQEGAVYRSNTLAPAHLADVLATEHIRTVLNLRGANTGEEWYQKETDVLNRAGVQLINVPLKSSEEPSDALLSQLVTALKEAPRPLLIHCKAGADRTGLASALYELLVVGKPADVAAGQLSFWYGHFPWLTSDTGAMDRTFWRVAAPPTPLASTR